MLFRIKKKEKGKQYTYKNNEANVYVTIFNLIFWNKNAIKFYAWINIEFSLNGLIKHAYILY